MSDPALNLLLFAALALGCCAMAWPGRGGAARIRRLWRTSERVRAEDVLKQMHELEQEGRAATVESVAAGTGIRRGLAARLLEKLEDRRLAAARGRGFRMTQAGRAYALRVVRAHRLWESFLADRTGVRPEDWHDEAEEREHELTASEADELAAALGDPAYDPHGDPIPSAAGDLPESSGAPLATLMPGEQAVVVHVEDEPREAYHELVALGLGPGVAVERLEGPAGTVRLLVDGAERELAGPVAANVAVEARAGSPASVRPATLAQLEPERAAVVAGVSPLCRGPARRRLLDLGIVPGTPVVARLRAPGDGPVAYEVRGALLALRREQAALVHVEAAEERP